jgi:hypothetical protein
MMHSAAEAEAKQKAAEEEKKKAAAEEQKKKLAAALDLKTASSKQAAKGKASDEQATTGFVTIHWYRLFFAIIKLSSFFAMKTHKSSCKTKTLCIPLFFAITTHPAVAITRYSDLQS